MKINFSTADFSATKTYPSFKNSQSQKSMTEKKQRKEQAKIFENKKNEIKKNIRQYDFKIKNLSEWGCNDFDSLYAFTTSPVLKAVSKKTPIRAEY